MKIIVVGATGKIGSEIVTALSGRHEIVRVGPRNGDVLADYTDESSVRNMFQEVGEFDALICAAGRDSTFKAYETLGDDDYRFGFERKFLGQVRTRSKATAYAEASLESREGYQPTEQA